MSEDIGKVNPVDWARLVAEAIRRRKAEKLTRREHAALASVSNPTIAAFDRGEQTLTLSKAFDILRVVGLVQETPESGAQEIFVRDAFARWRDLTAGLPDDEAFGRFPNGWYRIDYALEGNLRTVELHQLQELLAKAKVPYTGWAMFWIPTRPELVPREIDGVLECWLSPSALNIKEGAHSDFWRAAPTGRMFLIRGYQEDDQETFPPKTVFDPTLPIWRLGEALVHAARLSMLLRRSEADHITVRFRALYTGLLGRVLRSWANPLSDFAGLGTAATSDEAILELVVPAADIESRLAQHVFPLVASLYERFGVTGLSLDRVAAEIQRMQQRR